MIRVPFLNDRPRDYVVSPLTGDHAGAMADLHREDFSRPWSDDEFRTLLGQETVFGFAALEAGHGKAPPAGFVLARAAADEGEILTIAVSRVHRRQGLGWQLMDAALRELYSQRAEALFLEVDETNRAALSLYRRLGFREVGRRPAYYQGTDGKPATGALVMRRDLR